MICDTASFYGEIEPQWSLISDRSAKIEICRFQLLINQPRSGCWPDPLITNKLSLQQIEQRLCSLSREIDRSFCILLRNKLSLFRRFCNPRITPSTSKMQGSTKMMTAVTAEPCWQELRSTHTQDTHRTHSRTQDVTDTLIYLPNQILSLIQNITLQIWGYMCTRLF